jgi:serine protease Do
MNKCIITLWSALLVAASGVAAETKSPDPVALVKAVAPGLVRVEYHLQYDKADEPEGGLGSARCPNCGNFHGQSLREFLEQERPVDVPGFLVADDQVVTADPLLHPRFIKAITVRFRDQVVTAQLGGYAREHRAVMLALGSAFKEAVPLKFAAPAEGELHLVTYSRENGVWTASAQGFPKQVSVPEHDAPHRLTPLSGVAVKADGMAQGVLLGKRIPLGTAWQGSPRDWPLVSAGDFAKQTDRLQAAARAGLVRVGLSFRSPKGGEGADGMQRRYGRGDDGDDGESGSGTERSVMGLLLANNQVLVLANLKARQTARLDRINIFGTDGAAVGGKFVGSLKNFGAFVVALEKPLAGTLQLSQADVSTWRDQLLLRAEVSVQGETRTDYFRAERLGSCEVGWQGRLYPEIDGGDVTDAFLFSPDLELIALPIAKREQVSVASTYGGNEVKLTPARYLAEAVAGLPGTADPSNVPVSEEEENRLAWLGVELQSMNQELARANGVSDQTRDGETGAIVTYVHPDSPAARAGVAVGAVLLRLKVPGQPLPVEVEVPEDYARGQPFPWDRLDEVHEQYFERIPTPWPAVENPFIRSLTDLGFGTRYTAEFFVDGKMTTQEFEVVAGPLHYNSAPRYKSEAVGVTVRDLTYDVRRYLQRKADEPGVVISKIEAGSKASVAGVKPYELITHINEQPVKSVKDFEKLVAAGGELKLSLKRMAKGRIVSIKTDAK